jgi:hypothetical protein
MSKENLPEGWSEEKVRSVLAHYERQSEEDALIEDEAGLESSDTVMSVPRELVPKVRELILRSTAGDDSHQPVQ